MASRPPGVTVGSGTGGPGDFNVADVHEAIAARQPDHECLVFRDRRLTWSAVDDRSRRLASFLHDGGLGCYTDRADLEPWQSGQDHVALYLHNGNEYLETMLAAFKARVAPANVNYRYVESELRYLLDDAAAQAVVFHSAFSPTLAAAVRGRGAHPAPDLLVQVPDGSGHPLLPGAIWYDDALAAGDPRGPAVERSPDDLYILYTGGTTGAPKGVLWRQGDAFTECFGGPRVATIDDVVARATSRLAAVLAPPLMHGAGHWLSFVTWHTGGTVIVPAGVERFDPTDLCRLVERERATFLLIVGDAFARPLLDELDRHDYDWSCLTTVMSGGTALSAGVKAELLARLPHVLIVDGLGSSETGGQARLVSAAGSVPESGRFVPNPDSVVLSSGLDRLLEPGDPELGWLAKRGRLPLGYLGDPERTAQTFPVVDGIRYAVAGDRARLGADGIAEVQGRDSATINSGGEKIFAEEVEAAVKAHPDVYDCVVTSRPDDRWGNEVVAVVRLRAGATADTASLLAAAEVHLARYKLPRAFVFVPEIVRLPTGKPDYRWAASMAGAPG